MIDELAVIEDCLNPRNVFSDRTGLLHIFYFLLVKEKAELINSTAFFSDKIDQLLF